MQQWQIVCGMCGLFVVWNVVCFILMLVDKRKAVRGTWRIRESTLLWCAFLFGGMGVFAGMYALRHKTQTRKFTILVPIAMLCSAILLRLGIDLVLWNV